MFKILGAIIMDNDIHNIESVPGIQPYSGQKGFQKKKKPHKKKKDDTKNGKLNVDEVVIGDDIDVDDKVLPIQNNLNDDDEPGHLVDVDI